MTSRIMSAIRGRDTQPELLLRRALWAKGHRYRIHVPGLPGKPDIVFARQRVAVFCDGEFWHGHEWEAKKAKLKSNRSYWIPKIERNMARDQEVNRQLASAGWTVLRLWDFEILRDLDACVAKAEAALGRAGCDGDSGEV